MKSRLRNLRRRTYDFIATKMNRSGRRLPDHRKPAQAIAPRAANVYFGRLERLCNGGDVGAETALHVVTPLPLADRGGEHVGGEEAGGLRLLVLVGAYGAFVAVLRNQRRSSSLTPIVNSEVCGTPVPAGLPFAWLTSPWWPPFVERMVHGNRSQGLNAPRGRLGPAGRGGALGRLAGAEAPAVLGWAPTRGPDPSP
jgi:hypothetical protein